MKISIIKIVFISIFLVFLSGCKSISDYNLDKIAAPTNNKLFIQGTWEIYKTDRLEDDAILNNSIGDKFIFTNDEIVFNNDKYDNIQYKIKKVDLNKYISYNYKIDPNKYIQQEGECHILTVFKDNTLLYEFVILKDDEILLNNNNIFYYLRRISDSVDRVDNESTGNDRNIVKKQETEETVKRSGLLLGLRDKDNVYRTLWIQSYNGEIGSVLECNNLLLPREKGFWMIGTVTKDNGYTNKIQYLAASPINRQGSFTLKNRNYIDITNSKVAVSFVGNDYIMLNNEEKIKVLPVDNLNSKIDLKISDILGVNGYKAMMDSYSNKLMGLVNENNVPFDKEPSEESFKLNRKNGHWLMQGRAFSSLDASHRLFIDYDIYVIPPDKMVSFDDLYVDWNRIKERIPESLDAFTSPSKDIAVVICNGYILVYTISDQQLGSHYIQRVEMNNQETVVMAEWSQNSSVQRWKNYMLSFGSAVKK